MAVITEDGIEEDGSSGFVHLAPIEYRIAQEREIKAVEDWDRMIQEEHRKDDERELEWKQKFYQEACRKLRSQQRPPHLPVSDSEDELYEDIMEGR